MKTEPLRIVVGAVLLVVFAAVAMANWIVVVRGARGRGRGSWVPLVGGVSGALGLLLLPWPTARALWWLAPFLDWGTLPGLVWTFIGLLRRRRQ